MNLLCSSDSYASGLGIVNSFIKDQIVLIPLKDSTKHTLGFVTNNKQNNLQLFKHLSKKFEIAYYPTTKETLMLLVN